MCARLECSIAEENEEMLGWEANKSVGFCLQCAPGTSRDECYKDDDFEPTLTDNFEPAIESDSAEENKKLSAEGETKKAKRGRKPSWNEDQITSLHSGKTGISVTVFFQCRVKCSLPLSRPGVGGGKCPR